MTKEQQNQKFETFNQGFNEGFLCAAQIVAGCIIREINNRKWILPGDKTQVAASIRLITRGILTRRKIIPTTYDVMRGKAEEVKLDFDME